MALVKMSEPVHAGEFLLSEAGGTRSREVGVITGGNYVAGTVLGKQITGAAVASADAGNTGDGSIGPVTVGAGAKVGDYVLTIIEPAADGGDFVLENPDGQNVGSGDVGVAFTGGGLSFTLADGATDFASGDRIVITVAEGAGGYTEYDPAGTDGSEQVAGILYAAVDASAGDQNGVVIVRDAEVSQALLGWIDGISAPQQATAEAQLAELGIIVR